MTGVTAVAPVTGMPASHTGSLVAALRRRLSILGITTGLSSVMVKSGSALICDDREDGGVTPIPSASIATTSGQKTRDWWADPPGPRGTPSSRCRKRSQGLRAGEGARTTGLCRQRLPE